MPKKKKHIKLHRWKDHMECDIFDDEYFRKYFCTYENMFGDPTKVKPTQSAL